MEATIEEKNMVPYTWSEHEALALAKKKITGCFLCKKPRLAFIGAFVPSAQALWFDDLRPNATRTRFFGLCRRCFRKARRSNMGNVDATFRAMLAAEARGTVH